MAMQPTVESWIKRWLEKGTPYPENKLAEIRNGQEEIRSLLFSLASSGTPEEQLAIRNGSSTVSEPPEDGYI